MNNCSRDWPRVSPDLPWCGTEILISTLANLCGSRCVRRLSNIGRPRGAAPAVTELRLPGGPRAIVERYNAWAKTAGVPMRLPRGTLSDGEWTGLLFETIAEDKLVQPTILYEFPTDISPLSKQSRMIQASRNALRFNVPAWKSPMAFRIERSFGAGAAFSRASRARRR